MDCSVKIELRQPRTQQDFELYYDLRWRILREPWTRSRESGQDEHEEDAVHVMAWHDGKHLVGVGRLHYNSPEEGQIRYMAVEKAYARQGIGSRILLELEANARSHGAKRIVLNAREEAIPFYTTHNYRLLAQTSTLFDSLVHWRMAKDL